MSDVREETQVLLAACRNDPAVSETVFRLLEHIVARLDGPFTIQEVPTRPDRKPTPPPFQAVREILEEAKTDPCAVSKVSSRMCLRGTKGCTLTHRVGT